MEVILQKDFVQLGYVGDVVSVARGYARNYLIPQGICIEMSSKRAKSLKHQVDAIYAKRARNKNLAEDVAKKMSGMILEFTLTMGKSGKSFGSVSARDIEKALREKGYEFDRKQIRFDAAKSAGEHPVTLRLHSEVEAEITARVFAKVEARSAEAAPVEKTEDSEAPLENGEADLEFDDELDA